MHLRSHFLILSICFTQIICAIDAVKNTPAPKDLATLVREIVPLRHDGKMHIPADIKHVKLDIGLSNHAPYSQYWLTHENDLMVFGFEPNPRSITTILQGSSKWHHLTLDKKFIGKNFFLIPCALGVSKDASIRFFVTGTDSVTGNDAGCSSIYPPKYIGVHEIIEVPIFPLSEFFDLFPFDTHPVIDYIKIDAQGADLDIAKSAGSYLAERVIYVTLEAENYHYENTVNSLQDIEKYMTSIGFIRFESPYTYDPTYFNIRYAEYIKNNPVQIYQRD